MFYLIPPSGSTALPRIQVYVETRLKFLLQLEKCSGDKHLVQKQLFSSPQLVANSDCLIEGSRRDIISHFVLRLASIFSHQFEEFLINAETELFKYRLSCMSRKYWLELVQSLVWDCRRARTVLKLNEASAAVLATVEKVATDLQESQCFSCTKEFCCEHQVAVPWTLVPDLVKQREVELSSGMAHIFCYQVPKLLVMLFFTTLTVSTDQLKLTCDFVDLTSDSRLKNLIKNILTITKQHLGSRGKQKMTYLSAEDISKEVSYFPLCMQLLHRRLMKAKRLRHHGRITYTVFLKDIGLPVQENIKFWQNIYSQSQSSEDCGCEHRWTDKEGRRYTYNIRHLYGLEGRRRSYSSHSCKTLLENLPQPSDPGGCPFAHLNHEELEKALKYSVSDSNIRSKIVSTAKEGKATIACQMTMGYSLNVMQKFSRKKRVSVDDHSLKTAWQSQDQERKKGCHCTRSHKQERGFRRSLSLPRDFFTHRKCKCQVSNHARVDPTQLSDLNRFDGFGSCNYSKYEDVIFLKPSQYYISFKEQCQY